MYGWHHKLSIGIEFGVIQVNILGPTCKYYAQKLKPRLHWAYKAGKEMNSKESQRYKWYYDRKFYCMVLSPGNIVLVIVKVFGSDHKFTDKWEQAPHLVLSQMDNQPVFKVQAVDANCDEGIRILHRNILFPIQIVQDDMQAIPDNFANRVLALAMGNLLMDILFNDV